MTSIGSGAFSNCSGLTSITIPNSVTSIGSSAFEGCTGLTEIKIPNYVTSIGDHAFQNCSGLTRIIISSRVTSIGDDVFRGCSGLTSISIPYDVTSIGNSAFRDCTRLWNIKIPSNVTSIGSSAFEGCSSLTSITIPNSVTSIGSSTFANCNSLTSVNIPYKVTSIGKDTFHGCLSLYSVTSLINMPFNLNEKAFAYSGGQYDEDIIYMAATLYVPRGRMAMYRNISGWKKFLNIVETDTKFKLTYILDGEEYKTYEIQATEVITPEPDPYKEGYIFSGWSEIPYLMPAQDITVRGSFTIDPEHAADVKGVDADETAAKAYYSIGGQRMDKMQRGLNIVRRSDGTVQKVMAR